MQLRDIKIRDIKIRDIKMNDIKNGPRGARNIDFLGVVLPRAHQREHNPGTWDTRCRQAS